MLPTAIRREVIAILGMLSFALVWFSGIEVIYPRYFLWDDNPTFFLPSYLFNFNALRSDHTIPIINFFQFAGWNHLHAGQTGVLYPPAYLATWIATDILKSPILTIETLAILHLTGGMLGMYAWLRTLSQRHIFSMVGAIMYLTFPFAIILSRSWIFVTYAHCYLPICFALLTGNPSIKKSGAYIIMKIFFVLQGYLQYVIYTSILEIFYILLTHRISLKNVRSVMTSYLANQIAIIMFSLPILLPMAEASFLSLEREKPFPLFYHFGGMMGLDHFFFAQFFLFFDMLNVGINEMFHLGGSIIFVWMIWHFTKHKHRIEQIFFTLLILCAIAFLLTGPLYLIIGWLPVLNRLRWPFKFFLFFGFFYFAAFSQLLQWFSEKKMVRSSGIFILCTYILICHALLLYAPPRALHTLKHLQNPFIEVTNANFRIHTISGFGDNNISLMSKRNSSFNFPSIWKVAAISGYDPLVSKTHAAIGMVQHTLDQSVVFNLNLLPRTEDHLSQWSVRYIISDELIPIEILQEMHLKELSSAPGKIIYENPNAYPIAAFKKAPMIVVPIEYKTNRIRLQTNGKTGNILLRVAPLRGYFLVLPDGSLEPALQTENGIVISIEDSQVFTDVIYRSRTFEWGLLGTLTALMAACAIFIGTRFHNAILRRKAAN